MTFQNRFKASSDTEKVEIHLIKGESAEGCTTYAYMAIYASNVRALQLSLLTKTTELSDFGVIVASGEGEPTEEVKYHMKKLSFMPDST